MRYIVGGLVAAALVVSGGCGGNVQSEKLDDTDVVPPRERDSSTLPAPADAAGAPHPTPRPPLTYDGVDEHPGCVEPPCCNGGSPDTNIEVTSKCKYLVRAYWLCGCYGEGDLDDALRACVSRYLSDGETCGGMNCTTIENCGSLEFYDRDLAEFGMPPFAPTCDRSPRPSIMRQVYGDCR